MNTEQMIDTLSRLAHQAGQAVEAKMNSKDISNPEDMLKAQFAVQQYSTFINYESSMIKTIKDMLSGIIAKI